MNCEDPMVQVKWESLRDVDIVSKVYKEEMGRNVERYRVYFSLAYVVLSNFQFSSLFKFE